MNPIVEVGIVTVLIWFGLGMSSLICVWLYLKFGK